MGIYEDSMTADVIQFNQPVSMYILPCHKCGSKVFSIVCEGTQMVKMVCPTLDCETVYDFTEDGIEVPLE